MKKIITLAFVIIGLSAQSQNTAILRDSVAQTSDFQKKVKMATHKAANNILADPLQALRVRQYAQLVISEPSGSTWLIALSYGCMTNVAINSTSSDGDIEFTVNSLFAKFAYALYREVQPQ